MVVAAAAESVFWATNERHWSWYLLLHSINRRINLPTKSRHNMAKTATIRSLCACPSRSEVLTSILGINSFPSRKSCVSPLSPFEILPKFEQWRLAMPGPNFVGISGLDKRRTHKPRERLFQSHSWIIEFKQTKTPTHQWRYMTESTWDVEFLVVKILEASEQYYPGPNILRPESSRD